ncbi:uncharacterized protein [Coffea arabica]|uniref:Uncharacterized protein isoform X1 n=1 Tax=Coffea arabica TaxID=13443 RepID=A0ABM4UA72_COFAR
MAADEKLRALKKAYADIILNTAKEAAARIMASERKAQRFQRELQMAKEEALRMLLRLKQMMDSKISDAELTSLSQQKKIDELEAQLQEAEDIVKDLREELREVNTELERVRNSKEKLLDDQHAVAQKGISEENEAHYSQSNALPPNQSDLGHVAAAELRSMHEFQKNESFKFYSGVPYVGNLYLGCPDLPSIILRSKEPELYRNGCTQRIRASEGNLSNMLSGKVHKRKDDISTLEDLGGKQIFSVPNCSLGNLSNVEKKVEADSQLGRWNPTPIFCVKKKRATRYRKRTITSSGSFPDQLRRPNQAPDVSCAATHLISVRSDVHFEENKSKMVSRLSSDGAEPGLEEDCAETSENDIELGNSAAVHRPVNENEGTENLVLKDSAGSSVATEGETDLQNSNITLPIYEPNEPTVADRVGNQPIHERIIKYTFQRKRKRDSLSKSNGVVSFESDTSKRRTLGEESDPVEQEKSNLVTESSRHCGRLAHIAHQAHESHCVKGRVSCMISDNFLEWYAVHY